MTYRTDMAAVLRDVRELEALVDQAQTEVIGDLRVCNELLGKAGVKLLRLERAIESLARHEEPAA